MDSRAGFAVWLSECGRDLWDRDTDDGQGPKYRMGKTTRCLGLDVGDRRIGVAAGTLETGLARPVEVLDRAGDEEDARVFERLRELVKTEKVDAIVVGDPLNMDGSAGRRSQISRDFARRLKGAVRQARVVLFDERLSSFAADEWMERDGVKPARRKEKQDAYAAAVILADYFERIENEEFRIENETATEDAENTENHEKKLFP